MKSPDSAVRRRVNQWTVTKTKHPIGGGLNVWVFDEHSQPLLCVDVREQFASFPCGSSTAGYCWKQLSYLVTINETEYFVVHAWWGERIVIDLDHLVVVNALLFLKQANACLSELDFRSAAATVPAGLV